MRPQTTSVVRKIPGAVFLDRCERYRFMCIWAGAKGTKGVFRPVQNVPAYVFLGRCGRYRVMCVLRWYEQYRFMYFWIGAKGGGLDVFWAGAKGSGLRAL